jgi:NAD(P)-dependent dehydrogenase (short-subunit alcohol dehydrogenase family)
MFFSGSYSFEDKVAVITGAGSGIGRSTALAMANDGAILHVVDIDQSRVNETRKLIEESGGKAHSHVTDCTDADQIQSLADDVYSEHGKVDILHNNAGIGVSGHSHELSLDDWKSVIDLNLWGVIYGISEFLPRMLEQNDDAHIVNTASGLGLITGPYLVPYVATKFAVVGMTEALSIEYSNDNVNFSVICPGLVNTNIVEDSPAKGEFEDHREETQEFYEKQGASPDEIAEYVLNAIRKNRVIQLAPNWPVVLPWLLRRFSPGLYRFLAGRFKDRLIPGLG